MDKGPCYPQVGRAGADERWRLVGDWPDGAASAEGRDVSGKWPGAGRHVTQADRAGPRALTGAGLEAPKRPEAHGHFTEAGGARAVEELLEARRTPPRALVFGNDEMAIGGLAVLRRRKLRVPADVAVIGFDDIATSRHVRPALTTVRQPMRDIGEIAVRTLLDRLADSSAPRRTAVLPTELVVRTSCGCTTRGGSR